MSTYTVHARPWARGWELRIPRRAAYVTAARMARDFIRLDRGTELGSSGVQLIPEADGPEREAESAREAAAKIGVS